MQIKKIIELTYNIRKCIEQITSLSEDIATLNHHIIINNGLWFVDYNNDNLQAKITQKENQIQLQKEQIKQLIRQLNEQIQTNT
jgi:transcriptional regulator NrdR family protein